MGMGDIANTGMQASMSNMNVISNNIANANTYAFKRSTASFADLFPSGNTASVQSGMGVRMTGIQQDFSPAGTADTGFPYDLSINGNGFFVLKNPTTGQGAYSRYGHFAFNQGTGYFTLNNQRLQAFPASGGVIPPGSTPVDLQINTSLVTAQPTANVSQQQLNLNPTDKVPTGTFNPSQSSTYNYTTGAVLYDSLGATNNLQLYYIKTATPNTWTVQAYVNGTSVGTGSMTFNSSGNLASTTGLNNLSFTPSSGAASPQIFSINMTGATQTGSNYFSSQFTSDGYGVGTYTGYNIDQDGKVSAQYSNGQQTLVGQIAIANFQSPQNLQNSGNQSWVATATSGNPVINISNSAGNISQGTLELANVDMATELVNLINAQNNFQANAQVEQTYIQVMKTVTQL